MSKKEMLKDIKQLIGHWFCALEDEGCVNPWDEEDFEEAQYFIRKYKYTKDDYGKYCSKIS